MDLGAPSAEDVGANIETLCAERHPGNEEQAGLCFDRNVYALDGIGEWLSAYGDTSAGQNLQAECGGHQPDWERVEVCLAQGTAAARSEGKL